MAVFDVVIARPIGSGVSTEVSILESMLSEDISTYPSLFCLDVVILIYSLPVRAPGTSMKVMDVDLTLAI